MDWRADGPTPGVRGLSVGVANSRERYSISAMWGGAVLWIVYVA